MLVVAVIVVLLVLLVLRVLLVVLVPALLRRRKRADHEVHGDETHASRTGDTASASVELASALIDPVTASSAMATDQWGAVVDDQEPGADPAGPPAAINMAVIGTNPWAPARVFLAELQDDGYETTVDTADLVVVRDDDRLPVTVREPSGPAGRLIVTSTPELLPRTLEILLRSLLADEFTVDAADGRDVHLSDGGGTEIRLTVSELALA